MYLPFCERVVYGRSVTASTWATPFTRSGRSSTVIVRPATTKPVPLTDLKEIIQSIGM